MISKNTMKRSTLCTLTTALLVATTSALAHTEVKTVDVTAGIPDDNALKIGHGCETATGGVNPVIAQSVLFPQADLTGVLQGGSLVGQVDSIQDKSIFTIQAEKTTATGGVFGFSGRSGSLGIQQQGRVPFEFAPPLFEDNSCTTRITVNLAVADICSTSNPKIKQGRVNLWIPDNGSTYATQGLANGVEGIGEPPFIVINRDLTNNPIVAPCTGDAEITIEPTAAEINAKLGIPGYW